MKHKTKSWEVEGFFYDPYDIKPDWFNKMILSGRAYEYKNSDNPYLEFQDKRCTHKAFTGDFVHYDEFGRFDVWSAKHVNERMGK